MCKKFIFVLTLFAFVSVLCVADTAQAQTGPLGRWILDGNANDSSGNGYNGVETNVTYVDDAERGMVASFDGSGAIDTTLILDPLLFDTDFSWVFWFKSPDGAGNNNVIVGNRYGGADGSRFAKATPNQFEFYANGANSALDYDNFPAGEWAHSAIVKEGATLTYYRNGVEVLSREVTNAVDDSNPLFIGGDLGRGSLSEGVTGLISDVQVYDYALLASEVPLSMAGAVPPRVIASSPDPANDATDVRLGTTLTWQPGVKAVTHDLFIGTDFDDVNSATVDNVPAGVTLAEGLTDASYMPALKYGNTFYWKVTEVSDVDPNSPWPGEVWSFTTEYVAYPIPVENITVSASSYAEGQDPNKTIDGSGLADGLHSNAITDMWASAMGDPCAWIQYDFDQAYKIFSIEVWNYNGFEFLSSVAMKDVTIEYSLDGVDFTRTDAVTELPQTAGTPGLEAFTIIPNDPDDANGIVAKSIKISASSNWSGGIFPQSGLSEVVIFYKAVLPIEPDPASGTTGVHPEVTLSFVPGKEAGQHILYLSENENDVINDINPIVLDEPTYTANLPIGQYYWKIVEVNDAESPTEWAGPIWNFTTADYIVVDDMESYTDQQGKRMSNTYRGYYGASVGYPAGETNITHDKSDQSMPFFFDTRNTQGKSYISVNPRNLECGNDWTIGYPETLVFYVYGNPDNISTETMYVRFNNVRYNVVFNTNYLPAAPVNQSRWIQAEVDLKQTANQVNLSSVTSLHIGFASETVNEGAGMLLVDNIRLYRTAPTPVDPVNPGKANLLAYYPLNSNANDASGNGHHGTEVGAPAYEAGKIGGAVRLDGAADYIDCGFNPELTGSFSASVWANADTYDQWFGNPLVGTRAESNQGWGIRRGFFSNNIRFTTNGTGSNNLDSTVLMPLNQWIHVVAVVDLDAMTKSIYVNGELDNSAPITAGVTEGPQNMWIGSLPNEDGSAPGSFFGRSWYFDGMLDDVRIYDDALTAGEALYLSLQ